MYETDGTCSTYGRRGEEHKKILVGRSEGKGLLLNFSVDGRIILRWIFTKWCGRAWTGLISPGGGTS